MGRARERGQKLRASERKGAGLEERCTGGTGCGLRENELHFSFVRAALPPTSGFILLSGPGDRVQGTAGTCATAHVQGKRWFRKSCGSRRRGSTRFSQQS